jgi:hypothetical protein
LQAVVVAAQEGLELQLPAVVVLVGFVPVQD